MKFLPNYYNDSKNHIKILDNSYFFNHQKTFN